MNFQVLILDKTVFIITVVKVDLGVCLYVVLLLARLFPKISSKESILAVM